MPGAVNTFLVRRTRFWFCSMLVYVYSRCVSFSFTVLFVCWLLVESIRSNLFFSHFSLSVFFFFFCLQRNCYGCIAGRAGIFIGATTSSAPLRTSTTKWWLTVRSVFVFGVCLFVASVAACLFACFPVLISLSRDIFSIRCFIHGSVRMFTRSLVETGGLFRLAVGLMRSFSNFHAYGCLFVGLVYRRLSYYIFCALCDLLHFIVYYV